MIYTRSERRAMERAKEKHVAKLMKGGYGPWQDITDADQAVAAFARLSGRPPYKVWQNGMFIVQAYTHDNLWRADRVMIRWIDARPEHDWALFQKIKNELFGPERVALEVYPSEYHKQDVANMYWIWVLPDGFNCPIEVKRK